MIHRDKISRRAFLKAGVASVVLTPLAAMLSAAADGLEPLSEDDPMARALNYHADAGTVDASRFPNYADGQRCATCKHIKAGSDEKLAGCALFPGKVVALDGWCKVWAAGA